MKKGFTLIEMMFVIVVLGILSYTTAPRLKDVFAFEKRIDAKQAPSDFKDLTKMILSSGETNANIISGFRQSWTTGDSNHVITIPINGRNFYLYVGGQKCLDLDYV